jgi:hypothetical protein
MLDSPHLGVKRTRETRWPVLAGYTCPVQLEERDPLGWVMKALRESGNLVAIELSGIDEAALVQRPAEDELCLKEIAAHLRDSEELAVRQITSLLEEPTRPVPCWDIDVLPMERDYRSMHVDRFLSEFRGLRRETTHLLWSLRGYEWRRPGKHPYKGAITLEEIARNLAQHDLEHLWQVRRLKYGLDVRSKRRPRRGDDYFGTA